MTQPTAKIEVLSEVKAKVQLSEMTDVRWLNKKYAIPTKNHFFDPRFTMGSWDGRIHFFQANGNTYTYLLPEIVEYLGKVGYEIDLIDRRSFNVTRFEPVTSDQFSHIIYPDTGEPVELAEHQVRCINALLAETNGIVEAATGAGKTMIVGGMCVRFLEARLKTLVIVPSLDLIENTRDELTMLGFGGQIGVFSGLEKVLDKPITVSTWQALKNAPILMREFQVVLVDETHGARGTELTKLLVEFGDNIVYRYGMTGTMPDDPCEAMTVLTALGPVRERVPAEYLIKIGWLATLNIEQKVLVEDLHAEYKTYKAESFVSEAITYKQFKQRFFPDYKSETAYLLKNGKRTQWIAHYLDNIRNDKGNTFVLVTSIDQGKKLASLCPNAVFVHGADKVKARKQIYQLFKEHDDMLVIATVGIASTGINIKRIFNLVLVDLGKSFIRTIQSIGRGLRKGAGKTHLEVTDISSDLKYSTKHGKDRVKYYKAHSYPYQITNVEYANS